MGRLSDAEPTDIGERIRKLRGRVLTQQRLADAAGVSVDLIRKLEQGARQRASVGSLQRIARALDVDITDLLGRPRTVAPTGDPEKGVTAIRRAITAVDDLLPDYVDAGQAVDVETARRSVQYAWGAYWSGRCEQLAAVLPATLAQLRATVHTASTDEVGEASEVLARGYWATADTLVRVRFRNGLHGRLPVQMPRTCHVG